MTQSNLDTYRAALKKVFRTLFNQGAHFLSLFSKSLCTGCKNPQVVLDIAIEALADPGRFIRNLGRIDAFDGHGDKHVLHDSRRLGCLAASEHEQTKK